MIDWASVTVIVPVYNMGHFLAEALVTVLGQTVQPTEILVIDDGSTDDSGQVARGFLPKVRYVYGEHAGTPHPYNIGLQQAAGRFIAFLDADDLWLPQKLAWQLAAFQADPDLAIVFGQIEQFYDPRYLSPTPPSETMPGHIPSAMMVRQELFAQIGSFDPKWQLGYFLDWFLRAQNAAAKVLTLPHLVAKRRLHGNNLGVQKKAFQQEYAAVLKQKLDRQRRNAQK